MAKKKDIEEKTDAEAFTRAQDYLNSYFTLSMKIMSVICGGALVSIGGGFINLLSATSKANAETLLAMKQALSTSFSIFALGLCLLVLSIFITCLSNGCFMIAYDTHSYEQKVRERHEGYGVGFDHISTGLCLVVFVLIIWGFKALIDGFQILSI